MVRKRGGRSKKQREFSPKGIDEDLSPQFLAFMLHHSCHPSMVEYYVSAKKSPNQPPR